MPTIRILSAGAAQAVTEKLIEAYRRESGSEVLAAYGAVGAMKQRMADGEVVDVIILTRAMIEELAAAGAVHADSAIDLGTVGTGVAVRTGAPAPAIANAAALRETLLAAGTIVCPDPAIATAGKIVTSLIDRLGIAEAVKARLKFFPNGNAAMGWLAQSGGDSDLGITQVTEIKPDRRVAYGGPLPAEFQMKAVYTAGVVARSAHGALARDFVARYAAPGTRALLEEAGYELDR